MQMRNYDNDLINSSILVNIFISSISVIHVKVSPFLHILQHSPTTVFISFLAILLI